MASIIPPFLKILVLLESALYTLFNDTLDKAIGCSQQKLLSDQHGCTVYCHVRGPQIPIFQYFIWTSGHLSID